MIKKALLFVALWLPCALAQANDVGGHLALTLEADTNQGQARDLGGDLLLNDWLFGAYLTERDVTYEEIDGQSTVTNRNAGIHSSYEAENWGGGLAYNQYDDGELVVTREWAARLHADVDALRLTAHVRQRSHDLDLRLGNFNVEDAFDSLGLGLAARWRFDNDASVYGSYLHYDYSKDQVLTTTFQQLRLLYLLRPDYRVQLLRALFTVSGANAQVRGNLISDGYSMGFDYPIGEHWLSGNYTINEAEIDGSLSESVTLYWQHTLNDQWALDAYIGHATGDQLVDSTYAGLTLHWFL